MEEELVATVGWIQECDDLTHDPNPVQRTAKLVRAPHNKSVGMTCYAGRVDDERCSGTLHCKAKRNRGRLAAGVTCRDLELTECVVDDDRGARRNDRRQHKSERRAHNLMKSESEGVKANTHR